MISRKQKPGENNNYTRFEASSPGFIEKSLKVQENLKR